VFTPSLVVGCQIGSFVLCRIFGEMFCLVVNISSFHLRGCLFETHPANGLVGEYSCSVFSKLVMTQELGWGGSESMLRCSDMRVMSLASIVGVGHSVFENST